MKFLLIGKYYDPRSRVVGSWGGGVLGVSYEEVVESWGGGILRGGGGVLVRGSTGGGSTGWVRFFRPWKL